MVVTKEPNPDETEDVDSDAYLPTESGNFRVRVTVDDDGKEHSLLYMGLDLDSIPQKINQLTAVALLVLLGYSSLIL